MKIIITKIAGFVYENAKFLQKLSSQKRKRGTSSPIDGPGSFDQPDILNIAFYFKKDKFYFF